jgi:sulfoxide reductase heme-binding subunit YedZ
VLLTSLVRHRLGLRAWRAVHWLAYLAWPAAFGHALAAGGDLRVGWVAAVIWGSAAATAIAVAARLAAAVTVRRTAGARPVPRPRRQGRRELDEAHW